MEQVTGSGPWAVAALAGAAVAVAWWSLMLLDRRRPVAAAFLLGTAVTVAVTVWFAPAA